jgi:hypothetical protein
VGSGLLRESKTVLTQRIRLGSTRRLADDEVEIHRATDSVCASASGRRVAKVCRKVGISEAMSIAGRSAAVVSVLLKSDAASSEADAGGIISGLRSVPKWFTTQQAP